MAWYEVFAQLPMSAMAVPIAAVAYAILKIVVPVSDASLAAVAAGAEQAVSQHDDRWLVAGAVLAYRFWVRRKIVLALVAIVVGVAASCGAFLAIPALAQMPDWLAVALPILGIVIVACSKY